MRIVNPTGLRALRDLVDLEVSSVSVQQGITRREAYLLIAKQLGYSVRGYVGEEGIACIIALSRDTESEIAKLDDEFQLREKREVQPLADEVARLGRCFEETIKAASACLADESLDTGNARRLIDELHNIDKLSRELNDQWKTATLDLCKYYVKEVCRLLLCSKVVFGADTETGLIATILEILDGKSEGCFTSTDLLEHYSPSDLRRRVDALDQLEFSSGEQQLDVLDSAERREILVSGVAMLIENSLRELSPN